MYFSPFYSLTKRCQSLVLEAVPELLIIQLKKLRKIEILVEKIYKRVKFSMVKTVIGGKKYELKEVTYHSGSPMSGHKDSKKGGGIGMMQS